MPSIKDQSTVDAIAREYCGNGRNKSAAMRTIGYKESYCNTIGLGVVYGNIRVKEAIGLIDAQTKADTVASRNVRQRFWSDMMQDKDTPKAERLRASELLGRSEADFTDNIANTVEDQTKTLTSSQQVDQLRAQIKLLEDSESAGTAVAS